MELTIVPVGITRPLPYPTAKGTDIPIRWLRSILASSRVKTTESSVLRFVMSEKSRFRFSSCRRLRLSYTSKSEGGSEKVFYRVRELA